MLCNSFNKKAIASIKITGLEKKILLLVLHQSVTVVFSNFFSEKLYIKFTSINFMTAFNFRLYLQLKHIAWSHKSSE